MKAWKEVSRPTWYEGANNRVLLQEFYTPTDAPWPIIVLTIWKTQGNINGSWSQKNYPDGWFFGSETGGLPRELARRLGELLIEATK